MQVVAKLIVALVIIVVILWLMLQALKCAWTQGYALGFHRGVQKEKLDQIVYKREGK